MNDHDFQRPSLDDAIDGAVRDLMHRDPRPGLRRRVLSKLEQPARRSAWTWMLAPAGVLACLLVAVVLFNSKGAEVPATTATAPTPPVTALPVQTPQPPSVQTTTRPAAAPPQSRTAPRTTASRSTDIFGPRSNRVSAASLRSLANARAAAGGDGFVIPTPPVESGLPQLSLPGLEIKPLQLPALAPRR